MSRRSVAFAQASPFRTGAVSFVADFIALATPIAIIAIMCLAIVAMTGQISWGWPIGAGGYRCDLWCATTRELGEGAVRCLTLASRRTRSPSRWIRCSWVSPVRRCAGVSLTRALVLNMVFTMEVFLVTKNLLALLIAAPIHGLCAVLCARDAPFSIWVVSMVPHATAGVLRHLRVLAVEQLQSFSRRPARLERPWRRATPFVRV